MSDEKSNPGGFKETEAKLDSVDNILSKITNIIKKHWLIITLLLIGWGGYKFTLMIVDEMNKPKVEEIEPIGGEHFIVREYDELQPDGTWLRIIVWNDSLETVDDKYVY